MRATKPASSAICGEPRTNTDGWFMLTEKRWTDRLRILKWNEALVGQQGVQTACGRTHVQQMVVHCMPMGSLDDPLASIPPLASGWVRGRQRTMPRKATEPDSSDSKVVGELAVQRESLPRVLRENPGVTGWDPGSAAPCANQPPSQPGNTRRRGSRLFCPDRGLKTAPRGHWESGHT
jgi:hypothetical protein